MYLFRRLEVKCKRRRSGRFAAPTGGRRKEEFLRKVKASRLRRRQLRNGNSRFRLVVVLMRALIVVLRPSRWLGTVRRAIQLRRMRLFVNLTELGDRDVRVDLSRHQALMPQQFLNAADVGAAIEQVCCKAMTERMR